MIDAAEKLSTAAQKLSPAERLAVVDAILGSLDAADPTMDALWAAEAEDRLADTDAARSVQSHSPTC